MPEQPKDPRPLTEFAAEFLADDAVAIIVKQHLLPDDVENPVIFPPTYLRARNKAQTDKGTEGEDKKEAKKDQQQQSVYNLSDLGDKRNVVDIDSPQSDGNRSEPLFKSDALKHLVPQIVIDVNGTPVNILDAGHRAGDAVVRLSSLAAEFHAAFERADLGDHSLLASLAPTSLLYGAWDSRSTQTKLQRIIKASVRAENVRPMIRSATFIPAVDYVAVGAVKEELNVGEGDSNPLSSEGMLHALASQTLGGVRLTDLKLLVRTIKINLVALRQLKGMIDPDRAPPPSLPNGATEEQIQSHVKQIEEFDAAKKKATKDSTVRTDALRKYILGLALVAATSDPDLNLREGCNLRITADDHWVLVRHRKDDDPIDVDRRRAVTFAQTSGRAFFALMAGLADEDASKLEKDKHPFDKKDRLDAKFEKDVAEEFLGLTDAKGKLSGAERDKVRKIGPITRATLDEYWKQRRKREKAGDPIDKLRTLIDKVKTKNRGRELNADADKLRTHLSENPADTDELKEVHENITRILDGDDSAEAKVAALKALIAPAQKQPADAPNPIALEASQ
jgi:CRISPR-associated protein Csb1